jgi:hypothetical protein
MPTRVVFFALFVSSIGFSQGGFKKGSKGNDYIVVTNDGIQFAFGPTYLLTSKTISGEITDNSGARGIYEIKPASDFGFFAEFGMAHFPKWRPLIKNRLLDYVDWGFGYRQYSGEESTTIQFKNALGEVVSTQTGNGEFRNGYLYGLISAHNLKYIGKKKIDKAKKYFLLNHPNFLKILKILKQMVIEF